MPLSAEDIPAFEREVVLAAERHEEQSYRSHGQYTRVFYHDQFIIKYTDHIHIKREFEALRSLHDIAVKDGPAAPRVPRVFHYFQNLNGWGFIVMERIALRSVSYDELCRRAARAVVWLRAQHMDHFGSLGGGNPCHTVFEDGRAPMPFTSVQAAQTYLNLVVGRVRKQRRSWMTQLIDIDLTANPVVLTQSDMVESNFGVDLEGRPVVFDADTMQALPITLANFTLLRTSRFARDVSEYVFKPAERGALRASACFESLAEVRKWLSWDGDDLGVDIHGNVTPT